MSLDYEIDKVQLLWGDLLPEDDQGEDEDEDFRPEENDRSHRARRKWDGDGTPEIQSQEDAIWLRTRTRNPLTEVSMDDLLKQFPEEPEDVIVPRSKTKVRQDEQDRDDYKRFLTGEFNLDDPEDDEEYVDEGEADRTDTEEYRPGRVSKSELQQLKRDTRLANDGVVMAAPVEHKPLEGAIVAQEAPSHANGQVVAAAKVLANLTGPPEKSTPPTMTEAQLAEFRRQVNCNLQLMLQCMAASNGFLGFFIVGNNDGKPQSDEHAHLAKIRKARVSMSEANKISKSSMEYYTLRVKMQKRTNKGPTSLESDLFKAYRERECHAEPVTLIDCEAKYGRFFDSSLRPRYKCIRLENIKTRHVFTKAETELLLVALEEYGVRGRDNKGENIDWYRIQQQYLPVRTVIQLKYKLKNLRKRGLVKAHAKAEPSVFGKAKSIIDKQLVSRKISEHRNAYNRQRNRTRKSKKQTLWKPAPSRPLLPHHHIRSSEGRAVGPIATSSVPRTNVSLSVPLMSASPSPAPASHVGNAMHMPAVLAACMPITPAFPFGTVTPRTSVPAPATPRTPIAYVPPTPIATPCLPRQQNQSASNSLRRPFPPIANNVRVPPATGHFATPVCIPGALPPASLSVLPTATPIRMAPMQSPLDIHKAARAQNPEKTAYAVPRAQPEPEPQQDPRYAVPIPPPSPRERQSPKSIPLPSSPCVQARSKYPVPKARPSPRARPPKRPSAHAQTAGLSLTPPSSLNPHGGPSVVNPVGLSPISTSEVPRPAGSPQHAELRIISHTPGKTEQDRQSPKVTRQKRPSPCSSPYASRVVPRHSENSRAFSRWLQSTEGHSSSGEISAAKIDEDSNNVDKAKKGSSVGAGSESSDRSMNDNAKNKASPGPQASLKIRIDGPDLSLGGDPDSIAEYRPQKLPAELSMSAGLDSLGGFDRRKENSLLPPTVSQSPARKVINWRAQSRHAPSPRLVVSHPKGSSQSKGSKAAAEGEKKKWSAGFDIFLRVKKPSKQSLSRPPITPDERSMLVPETSKLTSGLSGSLLSGDFGRSQDFDSTSQQPRSPTRTITWREHSRQMPSPKLIAKVRARREGKSKMGAGVSEGSKDGAAAPLTGKDPNGPFAQLFPPMKGGSAQQKQQQPPQQSSGRNQKRKPSTAKEQRPPRRIIPNLGGDSAAQQAKRNGEEVASQKLEGGAVAVVAAREKPEAAAAGREKSEAVVEGGRVKDKSSTTEKDSKCYFSSEFPMMKGVIETEVQVSTKHLFEMHTRMESDIQEGELDQATLHVNHSNEAKELLRKATSKTRKRAPNSQEEPSPLKSSSSNSFSPRVTSPLRGLERHRLEPEVSNPDSLQLSSRSESRESSRPRCTEYQLTKPPPLAFENIFTSNSQNAEMPLDKLSVHSKHKQKEVEKDNSMMAISASDTNLGTTEMIAELFDTASSCASSNPDSRRRIHATAISSVASKTHRNNRPSSVERPEGSRARNDATGGRVGAETKRQNAQKSPLVPKSGVGTGTTVLSRPIPDEARKERKVTGQQRLEIIRENPSNTQTPRSKDETKVKEVTSPAASPESRKDPSGKKRRIINHSMQQGGPEKKRNKIAPTLMTPTAKRWTRNQDRDMLALARKHGNPRIWPAWDAKARALFSVWSPDEIYTRLKYLTKKSKEHKRKRALAAASSESSACKQKK